MDGVRDGAVRDFRRGDVARREDHMEMRAAPPSLGREVEAGHVGQVDVRQQHVERFPLEQGEHLVAPLRLHGDVAEFRQHFPRVRPDQGVVLDHRGRVWLFNNTGNAAGDWTDITGKLPGGANEWRSIAFVKDGRVPGGKMILVGGNRGVFATADPGAASTWNRVGSNMPNVPVTDVRYDKSDVLVAATLGRGAWTITDFIASLPRGFST